MSDLSESKRTKHHPSRLQIRSAGYFFRIGPWWSNLLVGAGAVMMAALPVLWLFAPV